MILAMDKSLRSTDFDGRLHVEKTHISKASVNPYFGREIPDHEKLGLDPKKVYRILRDPAELKKAASTFERLPILSKHIPISADKPMQSLIVGSIGSNVEFNFPYLDADISIWDSKAIAGIESGQVKELSSGYKFTPVMKSGVYENERYDGIMTEIIGNHLALVESGRAGHDVVVADSNPFKEEKMENFEKEPKAVEPKAAEPMESQPKEVPAVDSTPVEKIRSMLSGKVDNQIIESICSLLEPKALDSEKSMPPFEKKEDIKTAMDAYGEKLKKELREASEAARDVRPVVGDILAMDSAADVYGFALDHMKVDRKDVSDVASLRALFKLAYSKKSTPKDVVMDSDISKKYPNVYRFRLA